MYRLLTPRTCTVRCSPCNALTRARFFAFNCHVLQMPALRALDVSDNVLTNAGAKVIMDATAQSCPDVRLLAMSR